MEKTTYIKFLKEVRKDAIEEGKKHYFIFNELMSKIDAIDRQLARGDHQSIIYPFNADAQAYYANPLRVLQNNTSSLNLKNNPYANWVNANYVNQQSNIPTVEEYKKKNCSVPNDAKISEPKLSLDKLKEKYASENIYVDYNYDETHTDNTDEDSLEYKVHDLRRRIIDLESDLNKYVRNANYSIDSMNNKFAGIDASINERLDNLEEKIERIIQLL